MWNYSMGYKAYNLAFDRCTGELAGLIVLTQDKENEI